MKENTSFGILLVAGILAAIMMQTSLSACTLSMGYRMNGRAPLIGIAPDSGGLYLELYQKAANNIGCNLKVVRLPKKRILHDMEKGKIDFYPGFNFTEKRSRFAYYIKNGLPGGDVGISRTDFPEITDLKQLETRILFLAKGGANIDVPGVRVKRPSNLTLDRVIKLIHKKRGDFYIYNKSSIEYHLKINKISNLKIHADCCGGIQPLYLGFSRKSPNYRETKNPNYNSAKPTSIKNFPVIVSPQVKAEQFALELSAMKKRGESSKLYLKYYQ
ncbi:MAG: amino acid ABC transporter [Proteobacteria bacterium]|nr:amino acid ABC transporter [Pseudomonadota bacterium]